MTNQPEPSWQQHLRIQWLYARFQAVGRAQGRYLLLMVLAAGFAVGAQMSPGNQLDVPLIGLEVPRQLAAAATVTVLSLLALAVFGTGEALDRTYKTLAEEWKGDSPGDPDWGIVDATPHLIDFLGYSTRVREKRIPGLTMIGFMIFYPTPIVGSLGLAYLVWLNGIFTSPLEPPWLIYLHWTNLVLLLTAWARAVPFVAQRFRRLQDEIFMDLPGLFVRSWFRGWKKRHAGEYRFNCEGRWYYVRDETAGVSAAGPARASNAAWGVLDKQRNTVFTFDAITDETHREAALRACEKLRSGHAASE